jgi:hypothetical protein
MNLPKVIKVSQPTPLVPAIIKISGKVYKVKR